jgi:hypothetical protein
MATAAIPKLSPLKAGDTLSWGGTCRLPAGAWTATCQVRSADEPYALLGTVAVTLGTPVAVVGSAMFDTPILLLANAEQTLAWPVGTHELDLRCTEAAGGVGAAVVHTTTILLPVLRAVTGVPAGVPAPPPPPPPPVAGYAVWDASLSSPSVVLSTDGLTASQLTITDGLALSSIAKSTGKWSWELYFVGGAGGRQPMVGVAANGVGTFPYADSLAYYVYLSDGVTVANHPPDTTTYGVAWPINGVIGVHLDMDSKTLAISVDGVYQGIALSGLSGAVRALAFGDTDGEFAAVVANFGASPFIHAVPSGFNTGLYA